MKSGFGSRSLAVLALATAAAVSQAQHIEAGDAGNLPGIAQNAGLNSVIRGSILAPGDEDMYIISISNATLFSAVVTAPGSGPLDDSHIFLFDMAGMGIAHNDDIDGAASNFLSHLPVGNALYASLAPGTYLLAISGFDDMPKDSEPGEAETDYIFPIGTLDDIVGPNAGAGPVISWDGTRWGTHSGSYEITMTGIGAVPEPATLAVLGIGAAALLRRRKK